MLQTNEKSYRIYAQWPYSEKVYKETFSSLTFPISVDCEVTIFESFTIFFSNRH